MDDRDRQAQTGSLDDYEEESMGQLFESAGPRSEIPAEDLEAIMTAATMAWKRELERRSHASDAASVDAAQALPDERSWSPSRGLFAALAATLIMVIGLVWWWSANHVGVAEPTLRSARIEGVTGSVFIIELGQSRRPLKVNDHVPVGAILSSEAGAIGAQAGSDGGGEVRESGRASLRLANGLILRLDTGTHLRLVESSVVELLRGAVYVDSDRHGDRSRDRTAALGQAVLGREAIGETTDRSFEGSMIEIQTPLGVAHDVGTQFVVRLLARTDERPQALRVRVREGEVVTEQPGGSYRASAGEELVLAMDGEIERRPVDSFGPEWDWVLEAAPAFDAEGRTLREFLDWTARETGWSFELEGDLTESAGTILLHGDLSGLRPDRALFTVLPSAGLEAERTGDRLFIRRQR